MSSQAIVFLMEENRDNVLNKIPILLNIKEDPKTFKEAMASRDVAFGKRQLMMKWIQFCQIILGY